jgi:hypothetical protein
MRPGFCRKLTPLKSEGVGDVGCAVHPQPRVRKWWSECTRVFTAVAPKSPGIPARNGFNGLLRTLPGDRAFLPPSPVELSFRPRPVGPTKTSTDLTPASRRQDHTTSPYAHAPFVLRAGSSLTGNNPPCDPNCTPDAAASTTSRPASVTIAIRPSGGTRRVRYEGDLGVKRTEIFFQGGLDDPNHVDRLQQFRVFCNC